MILYKIFAIILLKYFIKMTMIILAISAYHEFACDMRRSEFERN